MSITTFKIEFTNEAGYKRLSISCKVFKGRIRRHIGKNPDVDVETLKFHLKYELEQHFQTTPISQEAVEFFIDQYISMRIKGNGSIFDHFDRFIEFKSNTTNERTNKKLVNATITSYRTAKNHFEKFLTKEKLKPIPSIINKQVLDDFYHYINATHNHKVKMHSRVKAFIKYLHDELKLPMDISFRKSVFNERYDNIEPDEDDIALTTAEIKALIALKAKFDNGIFDIESFKRQGKATFMGYEPVYKLSDHDYLNDKMGEETLLKLWFRVRDYLYRLDHTKESIIEGEYVYIDLLEDHYDYCVSSSVTIHAKVDNFKLSVDKSRTAELFFRGYTRESGNEEWVEILPPVPIEK